MKTKRRATMALLVVLLLTFAIPASAQTGSQYYCVLTYNGGFPTYLCATGPIPGAGWNGDFADFFPYGLINLLWMIGL